MKKLFDCFTDVVIGLFILLGLAIVSIFLIPVVTIAGIGFTLWVGCMIIVWLIEDFINKKKQTKNEKS